MGTELISHRSGDTDPLTPVRILVVEDHELVAASLATVLAGRGFEVKTDQGSDTALTLALSSSFQPHVVLLDLILSNSNVGGIDFIGPLSAAGAKVLVVSGVTDRVQLGRALKAGAVAVVPKDTPLIKLLEAISGCLAGRPPNENERLALIQEYETRERAETGDLKVFEPLTRRERDVLALLANGISPKGIAFNAHLKVGTIRSQIHSILAKLDVESQREAISLAFKTGWLASYASEPPVRSSRIARSGSGRPASKGQAPMVKEWNGQACRSPEAGDHFPRIPGSAQQ